VANEETLVCENKIFKFLTPLVIVVLAMILICLVVLLLSKIVSCIRRRVDMSLEQSYAYLTMVEFFDRCFLLGTLWASTKVFAFAVCFMNIVSTAVLGIFFYNLFFQPIIVHSPHFRTLYKKRKFFFMAIVTGAFIFGANFI